MANEPIVLTRETLYQQVWSEPIVHVARRVGLSGRGLGKLCARYSIPVPPRGWWAKKQHGHNVRQTSLPPIGDPRLERIVLYPSDSAPLEVEAPELLRESSPEWRIEVHDGRQISHPLVKRAATAIRTNSRETSKRPAIPWNRRHQRIVPAARADPDLMRTTRRLFSQCPHLIAISVSPGMMNTGTFGRSSSMSIA